MTEQTFRPERRPINQQEAGVVETPASAAVQGVGTPEQNMATMNRMAAIRSQISPDNPPATTPEGVPTNPRVSGRVPPQMQQALEARRMVQSGKNEYNATPQTTPVIQTGGSDKLQSILQGIKQSSIQYEAITLPSLGKFYDGNNGPTDGRIHIRPMTGEEEQILATPRFVKRGQAINMIFNRCIQENFDSQNFVTPDRTYLLIYLRGISYSPEYDVEVKCPSCDRKFSTSIDLNGLFVTNCPLDYGLKSLQDVTPTTKLKFTYRLSTGADEQRVQDYRDRKLRGFDSTGQPDDTLLYRTSLMIEEIEGLTDKLEIQRLLQKLPINDVAYLRTVVNEPPFGVNTTVDITCNACFADFEIELPLEANFFFPRARRTSQNPPQA